MDGGETSTSDKPLGSKSRCRGRKSEGGERLEQEKLAARAGPLAKCEDESTPGLVTAC